MIGTRILVFMLDDFPCFLLLLDARGFLAGFTASFFFCVSIAFFLIANLLIVTSEYVIHMLCILKLLYHSKGKKEEKYSIFYKICR